MNKDYKEMAHLLELQAEAIKGFAAIAEYLAASDCSDKAVIDAFHTMNDWMFANE